MKSVPSHPWFLLRGCLVLRLVPGLSLDQEEDFVTNLYNRNLLTSFDVFEIERILDDALLWLRDRGDHLSDQLRSALIVRLNLRKKLLLALAFDLEILDRVNMRRWNEVYELIPDLVLTKGCGIPAERFFSAKVQRRLASTVPPRPIVNISFDEACAHLKRLCLEGQEVYKVLECQGGSNIIVSGNPCEKSCSNTSIDIRLDVSVPRSPAFSLHSMFVTIASLYQR